MNLLFLASVKYHLVILETFKFCCSCMACFSYCYFKFCSNIEFICLNFKFSLSEVSISVSSQVRLTDHRKLPLSSSYLYIC